MPLRRIREPARGRLVGKRPSEIDLGLDEFSVPERPDFGVAEAVGFLVPGFEGCENLFAVIREIYGFEVDDILAMWPATREKGLAIDAIVARAAEVKVFGEDFIDRRAVPVGIGSVDCPNGLDRCGFVSGNFSLLHDGALSLTSCISQPVVE